MGGHNPTGMLTTAASVTRAVPGLAHARLEPEPAGKPRVVYLEAVVDANGIAALGLAGCRHKGQVAQMGGVWVAQRPWPEVWNQNKFNQDTSRGGCAAKSMTGQGRFELGPGWRGAWTAKEVVLLYSSPVLLDG